MNKTERKESIWRKEFHFPVGGLLARLPENASRYPAAVGTALFILSPALMAVLAMIHRSIDYTLLTYPVMVRRWVYPLSVVCFIIAALLELGQMRFQRRSVKGWLWQNPIFLVDGFIVLWMIVSQLRNGLEYAIGGYYEITREETFLMQVGYFAVLFPMGAMVGERGKRWLIRLHLMVSLILVLAAFVLWHSQTVSVFFYDWVPQFSSIYTNINYYAYYLSIAVPLAAAAFVDEPAPGWRALGLAAVIANASALSINNTMGGWVGCTLAMGFLIASHRILEGRFNRRTLLVAGVFVVCLYLPGHFLGNFEGNFFKLFSDVSKVLTNGEEVERAGSGRWGIWLGALKLIGENPVFGIGFEGVAFRSLKDSMFDSIRPHNEWMQHALFYGIPAAVAWFAMGLGICVRALRKRATLDRWTLMCLTGVFGYLVGAMFGLTLFATAPLLFLFLGMGYVR